MISPDASDLKVVKSGRQFGFIMTVICIFVAPLLVKAGGIFNYLQTMNALYFIPILAVVLVGMISRFVPAAAAKSALIVGVIAIAFGYFVEPFNSVLTIMSQYHFVALVFIGLLVMMFVWGALFPRSSAYQEVDVKATDLTPWRGTIWASLALLAIVIAIYWYFADFSVL